MGKENLHYIKLLDKTLLFMKEQSALSKEIPKTVDENEIPMAVRPLLFEYLKKEDLIFFIEHDTANGGKTTSMYISVQGLVFLENGGFINRYKAQD